MEAHGFGQSLPPLVCPLLRTKAREGPAVQLVGGVVPPALAAVPGEAFGRV